MSALPPISSDQGAANTTQAPPFGKTQWWSIVRKKRWVGQMSDPVRLSYQDVFTLVAQHDVQLPRRSDGVEWRAVGVGLPRNASPFSVADASRDATKLKPGL